MKSISTPTNQASPSRSPNIARTDSGNHGFLKVFSVVIGILLGIAAITPHLAWENRVLAWRVLAAVAVMMTGLLIILRRASKRRTRY